MMLLSTQRVAVFVVGIGFGAALSVAQSTPSSSSLPHNSPGDKTPTASSSIAIPEQAGIGVALRIEQGKAIVNSILPNTPAARNGAIKVNDQILAIAERDQEPVNITGFELTKIVGMIRGPKDSIVRLTVIPSGKPDTDRFVVSLSRSKFKELDTFVDGRMLAIGTTAPNCKFTRLTNDATEEISQFAGRIVIVEFWASWCAPCIEAIEKLLTTQSQHPEWQGKVLLLVISVDEKKEEAVAKFKEKNWPNSAIVWAGPEALKLFRVGALPTVYIIDSSGKVVASDHHLDVPSVISSLLHKSMK